MKPRTVFHPGHRIKMNALPIMLNVFWPWVLFTCVSGLCGSWVMYSQPAMVWIFLAALYTLWLASVRLAFDARRGNPEPTWYSYVAFAGGAALMAGTICGLTNFSLYRQPFYAIHDLKVIHDIDASRELGQNRMDAGILEFKSGSHLDGFKSWHFKHGSVYCVAPVVMNGTSPETQSYDFWAVGKDCCSVSASDFRCGAWSSTSARKAIRVMDSEAAPFYRLAVKQAETLYGIMAAHPIFFRWSRDPEHEVASWDRKAMRNHVFMVCVFFVFSLFFVALATCQFAWIGRGASPYSTAWNGDDGYVGPGRPMEPQAQPYGAL